MDDIQLLPIEAIKPYPKNPKEHPEHQVDMIVRSIEATGFDQPIVVDRDYVIIKGHGRRLAAIKLGLERVPVIVRDADENQARLLRVLDNRLNTRELDEGALRIELLELKESNHLELTGFGENDIPVSQAMRHIEGANDFNLTTRHKCPQCSYKW